MIPNQNHESRRLIDLNMEAASEVVSRNVVEITK